MRRRHFLFLQGNANWFFLSLGQELARRGHGVSRINVCGGDQAFWGDWRASDWRRGETGFAAFVAERMERCGADGIVLFGDCRPIHRQAIDVARQRGAEVLVFEEGYLRPHWITLEWGGVNGHSRLPDDPAWYAETARALPEPERTIPVGGGTRERIMYDFRWQAFNYLKWGRYPGYRTHRPYPIWAEYSTWAMRLSTLRWRRAQAVRIIDDLVSGTEPFFLFPLQLDSDSQVRVHSPFQRLPAAIDAVIRNFAAHAPEGGRLVIKNHPLDNGWIDYRRQIGRLARSLGLGDRVVFIDGGDLDRLIDAARGTVTVNSTVGLTALDRGRPAICLGKAIYDVPGLTFQGPLAAFWTHPEPPSAALYADFTKVVRAACLVNGNFYSREGMPVAVHNSVRWIEDRPDVLASAPPRSPLQDRLG